MTFPENVAPPATEVSARRGLMNTGIAALAFVLACAGLNTCLPFPDIDGVGPNFRFYQEHRDHFDTVFVGSSHIHHQISPVIFDRTMRDAGHPTHTFNFGMNGMFPPEDGYLVEHLLSTKPRHLKWVFIELDELQTKRIPEAENTRRSLYWHDWERTSLVLQSILGAELSEGGLALFGKLGGLLVPGPRESERRDLLFFHGALFARNFTNIGRKVDLAQWGSRRWKAEARCKDLGRDGDGYVPQIKEMSMAEEIAYETELRSAVMQTEPRFVSAATENACKQLAEKVRKAGAIPIFLVTPLLEQFKLGFRPDSGIASPVMSFNDAGAYPQFYRKEMRVDAGHLNKVAAEEFTRIVAQNFLQLIQENRIQ